MSSGPGGYTREGQLEPDSIVLGKPIAGGIPAAVYGFTSEVAARIRTYLETRTPGHSGIGTTLSGSRIQLALMRAMLESYFTRENFKGLTALAERLERGITGVIARAFGYVNMAPWIVGLGLSQIGEFSFVLARTGFTAKLISTETYNLVITATVLTVALALSAAACSKNTAPPAATG